MSTVLKDEGSPLMSYKLIFDMHQKSHKPMSPQRTNMTVPVIAGHLFKITNIIMKGPNKYNLI